MAYAFIIAAVRPEVFTSFKTKIDLTDKKRLPFLLPEKTIVTTHYYLSFGTGDQNLNEAMIDLLESGQTISDIYWHPLRPPLYQDNDTIISKSKIFKKAYQDVVSKLDKKQAEYWNMDFFPIIDLLDFAVENNLSLLTFLEKPQDKERADKVLYPIDIRMTQPFSSKIPLLTRALHLGSRFLSALAKQF